MPNTYLVKISGVLDAKLGMPAGQKIPAQTLQVMSQVGNPSVKREARGTMNLKARGKHNHPKITSTLPQKLPRVKVAAMNKYIEKLAAIHIKPSRKGMLHEDLGKPQGQKLSVSDEEKAKHSSDPAERKRATFALNARKWNHR